MLRGQVRSFLSANQGSTEEVVCRLVDERVVEVVELVDVAHVVEVVVEVQRDRVVLVVRQSHPDRLQGEVLDLDHGVDEFGVELVEAVDVRDGVLGVGIDAGEDGVDAGLSGLDVGLGDAVDDVLSVLDELGRDDLVLLAAVPPGGGSVEDATGVASRACAHLSPWWVGTNVVNIISNN